MTGRQRILAALNRQPVDRIPFVPLIDDYTLMEMPEEIVRKATGGIFGNATGGIFDPMRFITASRALGCDLMIRHVGFSALTRAGALQMQLLGEFASPVETTTEFKDSQLTETLVTPMGSLTGKWKFTDRVGALPHVVKYVVNNYEEMKIFHYAVDHMDAEPVAVDYDAFLKVDKEIGDEGIATTSISNSPLMFLIEFVWGVESTYFMLHDYREEVEDILEKLHASLKRYVEAAAASPARVVIQYENTSSTLLSPTIFRRYCLPYLNDYAEILKAAGKIYLIHMCGTLSRLVDDIGQGQFNGISDVAPPPTGDLPLDEAAAKLPGKAVIGGIDPTTFICRDAEIVKAEVSSLIKRIKPFRGVLLGSADVTPRGALPENIRLIRSLVDKLGSYT